MGIASIGALLSCAVGKGERLEGGLDQIGVFGALLRQLREDAGLTQEELAEKAGLSAAAVSVLERGERRRPYPNTVRSLAEALNLSAEDRAALLSAVPRRNSSRLEARATVPDLSLPQPATRLVGREQELKDICELFDGSGARLFTLTGAGGVGKTRLAMEAARVLLVEGRFPEAVFVSLASLREPEQVVSSIARSLGLRAADGDAVSGALRAELQEKRTLLVLDNFEHLLDAAPEVVQLLEGCPELVVLVTSRAPLRVRGEQCFAVQPLGLPATTRGATIEEVLSAASGQLFLKRARATSPSFRLTAENAGAVAAICWRLAGLPLALELAAAKVRLLDPAALLARMDQALSTAWARDLPERQRTMRAALDWSYELLSHPQRILFRRLSVFVGGFSLEATEAVGASAEPEEVLGLLDALVEQSLVQVRSDGVLGGVRYELLEPVRQFGLERLEQSDEARGIGLAHAAYFLALAEQAARETWGSAQGEWFDQLELESGNMHAALSCALEAEEVELAGGLCWALWLFWWARGYQLEGRHWSEALLARALPSELRMKVLLAAATVHYASNNYEKAEERWLEGLSISEREEDPLAEGCARAGLGLVWLARDEYEAATMHLREALPLLEACEDPLASLVHVWLGTASLARGDAVQAEREIGEALESARARGDTFCTYIALYNLAQLALSRNDIGLAARTLDEGIRLSEHVKDEANLAHFVDSLAVVVALRGRRERAAVLIGIAEGLLWEVGAPVYNFYNPDPELRTRVLNEARAGMGEVTYEEARRRGQLMSFEQAVAYALSSFEAEQAIT